MSDNDTDIWGLPPSKPPVPGLDEDVMQPARKPTPADVKPVASKPVEPRQETPRPVEQQSKPQTLPVAAKPSETAKPVSPPAGARPAPVAESRPVAPAPTRPTAQATPVVPAAAKSAASGFIGGLELNRDPGATLQSIKPIPQTQAPAQPAVKPPTAPPVQQAAPVPPAPIPVAKPAPKTAKPLPPLPDDDEDAMKPISRPAKASPPPASPAAAPQAAAPLIVTPPVTMPPPAPPTAGPTPAPAEAEPTPEPTRRPMRLGERLMDLGLISKDQLDVALTEQRTSKKLLGVLLVEMGFITESTLGEVLAESSGAQKFDPRKTMLDPEVIKKVPKEVAIRHKVIPIAAENDSILLAMADVYNVLAIDQVRRHFTRGTQMRPLYCSEAEILELIDQYYDYELSIDGILREIETGIREKGGLDGQQEGYVNPTVRLVNAILVDAIKVGSSDIHFNPEGQFLRLRYRKDGALEQIRSFHRDYWSAIGVRIKIMSGMNITETRQPQDGRISFQVMGREVDFRVATQPTVHGENIVMRLLDKTKSLVPLENLGFADHNIKLLKRCIKRPEGIIIVTGPTGSGKTTTLYSVLNYINSIDVNIMTLEDPVEYQLPLIRQTSVREGSVDFHGGIKSLMRQDPDIIFVGEVRDEDTALMAVRAALTGHQVYTTLHTNDALGAIPRLSDIGVPAHLLAGSLICTMAQRLARKLCNACKKPRVATAEEARIMGYSPDEAPVIHDPVGCQKCKNKGYKGRTAIIEILKVDDGMNELIATHATRNAMLEYALENGFVTMVEDGIDKVVNGEIDLQELISTIDMTDRLQ